MKNIYYLLFASILFSCNLPEPAKTVDTRPKKQLEFIKEIRILDSAYTAQVNDIAKKEVVDSGKVKVSNFILNNLNSRAENWEATVYSIDVLGGVATVELMFPKEIELDEKFPQYNAIILKCSYFPDNIKDKVKLLAKGDKVLVTGNFPKNIVDEIDVSNYSSAAEGVFGNPMFIFNIEDIKKIEPKTEK